jgi:hypothetical protein
MFYVFLHSFKAQFVFQVSYIPQLCMWVLLMLMICCWGGLFKMRGMCK